MITFTKPTWSIVREYLTIAFGLLMYASSWKGFLIPHEITGGGVTGIGAIIQYGSGFPISATYFIINALLLILSVRSLG